MGFQYIILELLYLFTLHCCELRLVLSLKVLLTVESSILRGGVSTVRSRADVCFSLLCTHCEYCE